MVDTDRLVDIVPHYVAMLLLVFLVIGLVETAVGPLGFWTELVIIVVVVFSYRPVVLRLGVAPRAWEERQAERERDTTE